jgi:hypothetical protein
MPSRPSAAALLFLRSVLWLVPAFGAWFALRQWVVAPPAWLAEQAMRIAFPRWVDGVERSAEGQVLTTHLRVLDPRHGLGELALHADALVYCYGWPLLAALLLASRSRGLWWKLPTGFAALLPFQAWGLCFAWLVQVAVQGDGATSLQTGFGAWSANLIAAGYQLGFLILPPLAPVVAWLALDRRVLAETLMEGALHSAETP